jgi:hypothetical protein
VLICSKHCARPHRLLVWPRRGTETTRGSASQSWREPRAALGDCCRWRNCKGNPVGSGDAWEARHPDFSATGRPACTPGSRLKANDEIKGSVSILAASSAATVDQNSRASLPYPPDLNPIERLFAKLKAFTLGQHRLSEPSDAMGMSEDLEPVRPANGNQRDAGAHRRREREHGRRRDGSDDGCASHRRLLHHLDRHPARQQDHAGFQASARPQAADELIDRVVATDILGDGNEPLITRPEGRSVNGMRLLVRCLGPAATP